MTSLDLFRLDGQAAVVTGGAGGLGAAMARGLAEAGAAVAVADADASRAQRVAADIAKAGGRALAVTVDVADRASVERMAAEVEGRLGPIEVLVNSAGITHRSPAAEFPEAEWDRVIAVNLTGVFNGCQLVGRGMLARRRGRIVNIASIAGQIGLTGTVAYAASKGGVVMLTRALAVEWAPHNVRVNAIAPSWFESNIGDLIHREPGYAERAMRRVPVGRMGTPDELIGAALYLASDASSMVTGHILVVDGGTLAS
jgi:NAD(P)-dependent dehydrogenase (short-subunit alcohol dehydrogenase family)